VYVLMNVYRPPDVSLNLYIEFARTERVQNEIFRGVVKMHLCNNFLIENVERCRGILKIANRGISRDMNKK